MEYTPVVAAVLAAFVTASVTSWAALRTTGTSWRATHANRTFEALADLLEATAALPHSGKIGANYLSAVTRVRLTVEVSDFAGLGSVMAHAETLGRLGAYGRSSHEHFEQLDALSRAAAQEKEEGGGYAASIAREKLLAFYAEQDQGGNPDSTPVRDALLDAQYCGESYISDLFISAETRRKLNERHAEREKERRQATAELQAAREELTSAVRQWTRNLSVKPRSESRRVSRRK